MRSRALGMRCAAVIGCAALMGAGSVLRVIAQPADSFVASRDHPAIAYSTDLATDRVADLNRRIRSGRLRLAFDGQSGYLRATLEALGVPVESQVAVFSQNSFQGDIIRPDNPRAIFFSDAVGVGWVRGGDVLEVAAHDPRQGVVFYSIAQTRAALPQFTRDDQCLACHLSWTTLGVPGWFLLTTLTVPDDKNSYAQGFASDHRTSFDSRWSGWYVTGALGSLRHMGNVAISRTNTPAKAAARGLNTLDQRFDTKGFPAHTSDVAALMVLEHQTHMINLITRTGWEARLAAYEERTAPPPAPTRPGSATRRLARVEDAAADLVDYLLFVYEAPLPDKVRGSSGFAEKFAALGPIDSKGRSLRQLDLDRRLLRYPCSYMIYSEAFDALPDLARDLVYRRLWRVLSGQERNAPYAQLSLADRRSIVDILRETKKGLPAFFQPVTAASR